MKRNAASRRETIAAAERDYTTFLPEVAVPVVTLVAQVLASEGHPFRVTTPASGVRLASDRSPRTYVDVRLDTSGASPAVVAEVSRERGHRVLVDDRVVGEARPVSELTEQDVLDVLLASIPDLVER